MINNQRLELNDLKVESFKTTEKITGGTDKKTLHPGGNGNTAPCPLPETQTCPRTYGPPC